MSFSLVADIRELINLDDVMEELGMGPNGSLIYCMEYPLFNLNFFFTFLVCFCYVYLLMIIVYVKGLKDLECLIVKHDYLLLATLNDYLVAK